MPEIYQWMRDAARAVRIKIHNLDGKPGTCTSPDQGDNKVWLDGVSREDAEIIAKHYEKWQSSHAVSASQGNLVQLAAKVISRRDAWWKADKPADSQERDDFLGAIADLTEAVLHAPATPPREPEATMRKYKQDLTEKCDHGIPLVDAVSFACRKCWDATLAGAMDQANSGSAAHILVRAFQEGHDCVVCDAVRAITAPPAASATGTEKENGNG